MVLGRKRLGIGELLPFRQRRIPNVAHRRNPHSGNFHQRLHQRPAATTGSNAADVERVVGGEAAGGVRGGEGSSRECAYFLKKTATLTRHDSNASVRSRLNKRVGKIPRRASASNIESTANGCIAQIRKIFILGQQAVLVAVRGD